MPVHAELLTMRCPALLAQAQSNGAILIDDNKLNAHVMSLFLDYLYANYVVVQRDMRVLVQLQYCAEKFQQPQLTAELRLQISALTRDQYCEYLKVLTEFGMTDQGIVGDNFNNTPREVIGNRE